MSLLISGVFWDKVEVLSADDKGSVHLGGYDGSGKDTSSDGDFAGERAFLVWLLQVRSLLRMARRPHLFSCSSRTNVCALNRSLWRPEAQPNILVPSSSSFADLGAPRSLSLLIDENVRLFLIGAL